MVVHNLQTGHMVVLSFSDLSVWCYECDSCKFVYFFSHLIVNTTVGPLLSGCPQDFENWPLNRGWPFNRGIKYCSLETLK